ncbi:MAG: hypothetical protein E6559_17080 [Pantoea sp.]|nr:hypothetical protein [Pantoea sp.]
MGKHYTTVEIRAIREMGQTMTAAEIGKRLGRSPSSIYCAASSYGIKLNTGCRKHHTMEQVREVVRLRRSGMTFKQVSEATGVALSSCMYLFRTHA